MARKSLTQQLAEANERLFLLEQENQKLSEKATYTVSGCVITAAATPKKHNSRAIEALAMAAAENAKAIAAAANAAKGVSGNIETGIKITGGNN